MKSEQPGRAEVIAEGDTAPGFTLDDQAGKPVSLADFAGTRVVLYFYPRADTPGCTTQACGIRDRATDYAEAGVEVLGISPDPVEDIAGVAAKNDLAFTLLADPDHEVAEAYGTWVEKSMYGKKYMGVQRATFIIGKDGKVEKVFPKVQPKKHDDLVLGALAEL
ncbi:MAG: thioredoxin-dependent thiol peroxidase, partial [Solirubrobacterales bacterium]